MSADDYTPRDELTPGHMATLDQVEAHCRKILNQMLPEIAKHLNEECDTAMCIGDNPLYYIHETLGDDGREALLIAALRSMGRRFQTQEVTDDDAV